MLMYIFFISVNFFIASVLSVLGSPYNFAIHFQGFKPPDEGPSEYQSIPLNKIEDFGVHCKQWVDHWWQESLNLELKVKIIKELKYIKNSCGSIIMSNKDYVFRQ